MKNINMKRWNIMPDQWGYQTMVTKEEFEKYYEEYNEDKNIATSKEIQGE